MGLPDFLCIGAQKAGTAWLQINLSQHPEIWTPFSKELHYFDARMAKNPTGHRERVTRQLARAIQRAKWPKQIEYLTALSNPDIMFTPEWYETVFSRKPAHKKAGEFTPRYSTLPESVLDEMIDYLPDTKFIYLIREPVARALSGFRMRLQYWKIDPTDPAEVDSFARAWMEKRSYIASDYADFIPRWDARLEEGRNLFYAPFGAIRSKPAEVLRDVERFLGVGPFDDYRAPDRKRNSTDDVVPPDWLASALAEDLERHTAFLKERFPPEFVAALG